MTALEIIDTAVKIGLGAAISGLTAFFINKSQHSHESKKSLITNKVELIKECALKLDKSSTIRNSAESAIQRKSLTPSDKTERIIDDELRLLDESYNLLKESRVLASLAGQVELNELFSDYLKEVSDKKVHFLMNGLNFNSRVLNKQTNKCEKLSGEIIRSLGSALDSLHN